MVVDDRIPDTSVGRRRHRLTFEPKVVCGSNTRDQIQVRRLRVRPPPVLIVLDHVGYPLSSGSEVSADLNR